MRAAERDHITTVELMEMCTRQMVSGEQVRKLPGRRDLLRRKEEVGNR